VKKFFTFFVSLRSKPFIFIQLDRVNKIIKIHFKNINIIAIKP